MNSNTGFIEHRRQDVQYRLVDERIKDYSEIEIPLPKETLIRQAARCMGCGISFCHGAACPLGNFIPDINELLYKGHMCQAC